MAIVEVNETTDAAVDVLENKCFLKFHKIHRKTLVKESLIIKVPGFS